jgi:hypothetical protein
VCAGDAVLGRIRIGFRRVAASDGHDLDPVGLARGGEDLVVDPRRREQAEAQPAHAAGGHDPAQAAAPADKKQTQIAVYQRGQTTFNRRFFETKFAGFLRMVPGDAERGKVIYVKSARGEHVGTRISRIQPNEIYLQVTKGEATSDIIIPFNDIQEVQVRPKEA